MSFNSTQQAPAGSAAPDRGTGDGASGRAPAGGWLMRQGSGHSPSPVMRLCAVVSEVARNRRRS